MAKNPLIRRIPQNKSKPMPNQSAGILDDFAQRKTIASKQGTMEHVPANDSDIVNKKFLDDNYFDGSEFTAGSIIFSNGTDLVEDNSNLFWDNTLKTFGIGTANPFTALHIKHADLSQGIRIEGVNGTSFLQFQSSGGTDRAFYGVEDSSGGTLATDAGAFDAVLRSEGDLLLLAGGVSGTAIFIKGSDQFVGLGTITPDTPLRIASQASSSLPAIRSTAAGAFGHTFEAGNDGVVAFSKDNGQFKWGRTNSTIGFGKLVANSNGITISTSTDDSTYTERMRIVESSGDVGIGITPDQKFHVLLDDDSGSVRFGTDPRGAGFGEEFSAFVRVTGGVDATGQDAVLWLRNEQTNLDWGIYLDSSDSDKLKIQRDGESPYVTLTSGGNLGIAITAPEDKLHTTVLRTGAAANKNIQHRHSATDSVIAFLDTSDVTLWEIRDDAGVLKINEANNATPRFTIAAGGLITMGGTSNAMQVSATGDAVFLGSGGLPYANMYGQDVGSAITIATAGKANKVQITGFAVNGPSNNMTPDHTNDHITVVKAGHYIVNLAMTVSGAGGDTDSFGFSLYKNNGATEFANVHGHRNMAGGAGDISSIHLSGIVDLAVNDTIEVWAWNEDDTDNATLDDISLSLVQIGGT